MMRDFLRKLLGAILNAVSFGDLVFILGVVFVFYGVTLVYGLGWAYVIVGTVLVATAYMGDLASMLAVVLHGSGGDKKAKTR